MRKPLFLLVTILFAVISLKAQNSAVVSPAANDTANYPYWIEMMQDPSVNFFKVQRAFNLYWENRPVTKSSGWKPFKRWEYSVMKRINPDGSRPPADQTFQAYEKVKNSARSSNGNWISLGPAEIPAPGPAGYEGLGRLNAIGFHPTDPNTIFACAPSGGLWHSYDGGQTWASNTDTLPTLGVSSIIIDYSNTNNIYIGTGDRDAGDAPGMGVFKSSDGGMTWTTWNNGMSNKTVGKMLQHPSNPQIMLAATSGGVYRTVDGGANWTQSKTGNFKDMVFKPGDPNTVYATAGSGFYLSTDNGVTFNQITSGLPGGQRSVIAVTPANPGYVYLLMSGSDSGFKGFYRSTDSGLNFTTRSTGPNILDWSCDGSGSGGQGWYDLAVAANPLDAEDVYVGGVNVWRSTNGGMTWVINSHWYGGCGVPAVHADCHFLAYSPVDGQLYAGNDGGVYTTNNSGATWVDHTEGMTIGQIYKLGQSQTISEKIINGFQDNGTYTLTPTGWIATGGGDGMECAIDPADASWTYHTIYYGDIFRKKNNNNEVHIAGNGVNGITESGAWVTPFILSEGNPRKMFVGYKNVWRCNNVKISNIQWTKISNNLGGSNGADIAVLEMSPADTNILYMARSDGKLFRSDNCNDGLPLWTDLSNFLPTSGTAGDVEASPLDPNVVYITMGNNIYKSTDKGLSWTVISGNLTGIHLNSIAYYKNAQEGLYLGTDAGVYYKEAGMTDWISFSNGLPANGRVEEVEIYYDNDSISMDRISACTYGRGLWQSDMYHAGPVADFSADKTLIPFGCSINFTDLSSGGPTNWEWTFTGAIPSTSADKNPSNIQYNVAGTYPVKLKSWNTSGSDSITKTDYITVSSTLLPAVEFTSDKNLLCEGESVHLYDQTENCPNGWHWEFYPSTLIFLEGTSAYSQNPVVLFTDPGVYGVKLTAMNNVGSASITKNGYILYGGYTLPFTEGFEDGFEAQHWTVVNHETDITWDTIELPPAAGGKVAWMNFYDCAGVNNRDQLITPPMNFENYSTLSLDFSHAYAARATLKDSLIVKISDDCGSTWTRILAAGPNNSNPNLFATHAPTLDPFYPESENDWCGSAYGTPCYSLDISAWAGKNNVMIMFEAYNKHGNNLFVDDIAIHGPVGVSPAGDVIDGVRIYPNPSEGLFNITVGKSSGATDIAVYELNGRQIWAGKILPANSPVTKVMDLSGYPGGIYYVRLTSDDKTRIEKIIIR